MLLKMDNVSFIQNPPSSLQQGGFLYYILKTLVF